MTKPKSMTFLHAAPYRRPGTHTYVQRNTHACSLCLHPPELTCFQAYIQVRVPEMHTDPRSQHALVLHTQGDDTMCLEMLVAPQPCGWQGPRDASSAHQVRMQTLDPALQKPTRSLMHRSGSLIKCMVLSLVGKEREEKFPFQASAAPFLATCLLPLGPATLEPQSLCIHTCVPPLCNLVSLCTEPSDEYLTRKPAQGPCHSPEVPSA